MMKAPLTLLLTCAIATTLFAQTAIPTREGRAGGQGQGQGRRGGGPAPEANLPSSPVIVWAMGILGLIVHLTASQRRPAEAREQEAEKARA